jgi:protein-disulfide isomerase
MNKKNRLGAVVLLVAAIAAMSVTTHAYAAAPNVKHVSAKALAAILARPLESPPVGATPGDVTVVEYFDYNCPVCRETEGELKKLVSSDPKIRLIYKDWPVFGAASVYAAYCSFAAAAQGKYTAAHEALIASSEDLDSKEVVQQVLRHAGFDIRKLDADIAAHEKEYSAALTRNNEEASSLGLRGTPGLIVGDRLVAGGLDFRQLTAQVAAARSRN